MFLKKLQSCSQVQGITVVNTRSLQDLQHSNIRFFFSKGLDDSADSTSEYNPSRKEHRNRSNPAYAPKINPEMNQNHYRMRGIGAGGGSRTADDPVGSLDGVRLQDPFRRPRLGRRFRRRRGHGRRRRDDGLEGDAVPTRGSSR
jgi:hypothetical protein